MCRGRQGILWNELGTSGNVFERVGDVKESCGTCRGRRGWGKRVGDLGDVGECGGDIENIGDVGDVMASTAGSNVVAGKVW